jgi:hypothetical protein
MGQGRDGRLAASAHTLMLHSRFVPTWCAQCRTGHRLPMRMLRSQPARLMPTLLTVSGAQGTMWPVNTHRYTDDGACGPPPRLLSPSHGCSSAAIVSRVTLTSASRMSPLSLCVPCGCVVPSRASSRVCPRLLCCATAGHPALLMRCSLRARGTVLQQLRSLSRVKVKSTAWTHVPQPTPLSFHLPFRIRSDWPTPQLFPDGDGDVTATHPCTYEAACGSHSEMQ